MFQNREEKDEEFLAFADPKSPKGKTFHKVLKKFIKKEMQKSDFDVKIIWIDPSEYPMVSCQYFHTRHALDGPNSHLVFECPFLPMFEFLPFSIRV